MISFKAAVERTELIDPAGHRAEQLIEHRVDPLTGTVASVNAALGDKARAFLGAADVQLLAEQQEKTKAGCPFCSASERGTRFLPELVPGGRLRVGSAVAMPNLFSKAAFDSVVVLDEANHVLFPSRVGRGALADALRASTALVLLARRHDPALVHHAVGMNFLLPAGSSVPHPHFQVHVRSVAYSGVARLLEAGRRFREREGRPYWPALLEQERAGGARWVGRTGPVEWLVPFAPGHQREVLGVLRRAGSLVELAEGDAEAFADGIDRVISAYEEAGAHAFNFVFLSAPEPGHAADLALTVKICSRPAYRPLYANHDTWFTPKLLGDDVHLEAPERWAAHLRARW